MKPNVIPGTDPWADLDMPDPGEMSEARAPGMQPPLLRRPGETKGWSDLPPEDDAGSGHDGEPPRRGLAWLRHPLVLLVLVPTLLTAAFEYLVAADQFQSEARFIVRTPEGDAPASSLSQMLGMPTGSIPADAHSVGEYLLSHDAVDAVGRDRLVKLFRRPEADPVTRLRSDAPQPETLLRYYRDKVHVTSASDTGITTLTVRAFRPDDAKQLADLLLTLGEARVNSLNARMLKDGLQAAERQVEDAETRLAEAQDEITAFRQSQRDIDPERTGGVQIEMTAALQQQAAQARANFEAMAAAIPPSAPQYAAMQRKVASLDRQVAAAQARLAGSDRSVAGGLGNFEALRLRQEFAAKRYEAASTSVQAARERLLRQQLFIVSVVEPNRPGKALYPNRLQIVATVFFGLLFAYAIGWLILAGVREHAD